MTADPAPRTHAEASRQRRDIVSGAVMEEDRLIRFVASPSGEVVPDLSRKLPGRGLWVEATRTAVDLAAKKGGFSRAAKTRLGAAEDLADRVEALLARQCLDRLGLARRAGALTSGFEKVASLLTAGKAVWLIDGVRRIGGRAGKTSLSGSSVGKPPAGLRRFHRRRIEFGLGPRTCDTHRLPCGTLGGALDRGAWPPRRVSPHPSRALER